MPQYYKIISKPYTFYAYVSQHDDSDEIFISIGGKRRCISIVVYTQTKEAVLQTLEFHESCDTNQKLKRGTGTVHMFKSSIMLLKQLFPYLKKVSFTDSSMITCMREVKVDLQSYYIALHGKTWYEKQFDATPTEEFNADYTRCKKEFLLFLKSKPEYNILMRNVKPFVVTTLLPLYNKSKNLESFIYNVNKDYDCFMFQDWLFSSLIQYIPFIQRIVWEINVDKLIMQNVKIESLNMRPVEMFRGGGKFADFYRYNI